MMRNAYVMMTALLPTTGHADLIDFASRIVSGNVLVIVQGRSFEPIHVNRRMIALRNHFRNYRNVRIVADEDDNAPQNPNPELGTRDYTFWKYWANDVRGHAAKMRSEFAPIDWQDAFVASEPYGATMAEYLECQFIPYDIGREINPTKGSDVRKNLWSKWDEILPEFKADLQMNVVLFGQESVGKTTLARSLSCRNQHSQFIPEYARPYLEAVGSEITDSKMKKIEIGQNALEYAAFNNGKRYNFFDTDLLSTIGYYRIFEQRMGDTDIVNDTALHLDLVINHQWHKRKMLYVLLPDDIPFEEDELRYGGNVRQSTYKFWKNLLDQYYCNYIEVPRGLDFRAKLFYIEDRIKEKINEIYLPICEFERD